MDTTKAEVWKPIPDFPGYEVSNHGRVRSFFRFNGKGWELAENPQRVLKISLNTDGYPFVALQGKQMLVSRLVMLAFVAPCPEGLEVCHNDGDQTNNLLSNLRYDTHVNNLHDAVWHGNRRFSPSEVIEIRNKRMNGIRPSILAKRYGVTPTTITLICNGTNYKSVGGPLTRSKLGRPRKQPAPAPAGGNGGKE